MTTVAVPAVRSYRQDAVRRFRRNRLAIAGAVIVTVLVLVALIGPFVVQSPSAQERLIYLSPPNARHWLGTDNLGRDVLARVIYGMRLSILIGLAVTALSTLLGVTLGAIAGWAGSWFDAVIMRIVDIFIAIPYIVLAFAFITILGRGVGAVIITLAITSWLETARLVRGGFLQTRNLEYVEAARVVGVKPRRIVTRHILPNVLQPLMVVVALSIGDAILAEAALSYLGVGVQPPSPSLGLMISDSRAFFSTDPRLLFVPGIAIVLTVLGFLLLGEGLRDAMDVRE